MILSLLQDHLLFNVTFSTVVAIDAGKEIHYHQIDRQQVIFCGVPQEYLDFLNQ